MVPAAQTGEPSAGRPAPILTKRASSKRTRAAEPAEAMAVDEAAAEASSSSFPPPPQRRRSSAKNVAAATLTRLPSKRLSARGASSAGLALQRATSGSGGGGEPSTGVTPLMGATSLRSESFDEVALQVAAPTQPAPALAKQQSSRRAAAAPDGLGSIEEAAAAAPAAAAVPSSKAPAFPTPPVDRRVARQQLARFPEPPQPTAAQLASMRAAQATQATRSAALEGGGVFDLGSAAKPSGKRPSVKRAPTGTKAIWAGRRHSAAVKK
jgi:hypothetical protein